jgi:hypothetical protein
MNDILDSGFWIGDLAFGVRIQSKIGNSKSKIDE